MDNVIQFRTKEQWARENVYRRLEYLVLAGRLTMPSAEELRADMATPPETEQGE